MCTRYTRPGSLIDYLLPLGIDRDSRAPIDDALPSWNVAPGTAQLLIYSDGGARRALWGYRPTWVEAKKLPPVINAKSEDLSGTWEAMVRRGRVIVPADHWYEWSSGADGGKQPYAIRRRDGAPLFMAGLCSPSPDAEPLPSDGFMIVTDAADVGLVNVHDRRPVVFEPDVARDWLNVNTLPDAAIEYACRLSVPAVKFVC